MKQIRREKDEQTVLGRYIEIAVAQVSISVVLVRAADPDWRVEPVDPVACTTVGRRWLNIAGLQIEDAAPRALVVLMAIMKTAIVRDMTPTLDSRRADLVRQYATLVDLRNGMAEGVTDKGDELLHPGVLGVEQIELAFKQIPVDLNIELKVISHDINLVTGNLRLFYIMFYII